MNPGAHMIWLDGVLHPAAAPVLALSERGAALGDGLFETIRIEHGQACHFGDHWARLCASAKVLRLAVPYSRHVLESSLRELAAVNGVQQGAARLLLSRGTAPRGLAVPARASPVMALSLSAGLPRYDQPPVLGLSRLRRNPWSVSSAHKTLSYIDNVAARQQQHGTKPRPEVVMLDHEGHVASASAANLFWWQDGCWHTPALNGAILPGTMRARVLASAAGAGIAICEGAYEPRAMMQASCAFMSNALIGMQKLAGVDFGACGQARYQRQAGPWAQLCAALKAP